MRHEGVVVGKLDEFTRALKSVFRMDAHCFLWAAISIIGTSMSGSTI